LVRKTGNVAQNVKTMDLIKIAEQAFATETKSFPVFKAGDTITVTYRIKEENKERLQKFRGVCIQRKGTGVTQTFTIRKISNGVGVERIFPLTSPFIESIETNKSGKVRRARIYYLRKLTGKKARIKEKKRALIVEENTAQEQ
jgi:large subunit ribosomal protein L19